MTMCELQLQLIKKYARIFEKEAKFSKKTAFQAATDMLDKGLTYDQAVKKYTILTEED